MNKRIVQQKLKEIEESLDLITRSLPTKSEEFKVLGLTKDGIYKRLEFSIQNLIDIFSMIYSSLNIGVPSSVDDIFDGLLEKKIFPKKILSRAAEMKGLRNILTHRYGKIDDKIVYELLTEKLDDFEEIVESIEMYLNAKKN